MKQNGMKWIANEETTENKMTPCTQHTQMNNNHHHLRVIVCLFIPFERIFFSFVSCKKLFFFASFPFEIMKLCIIGIRRGVFVCILFLLLSHWYCYTPRRWWRYSNRVKFNRIYFFHILHALKIVCQYTFAHTRHSTRRAKRIHKCKL